MTPRTGKRPTPRERARREEQAKAAEAAKANGAVSDEAIPEVPDGPEVSGVLVSPVYDENGGLQVNIQRVGDVRAAEMPTLLESAVKLVRQGMGLDARG